MVNKSLPIECWPANTIHELTNQRKLTKALPRSMRTEEMSAALRLDKTSRLALHRAQGMTTMRARAS